MSRTSTPSSAWSPRRRSSPATWAWVVVCGAAYAVAAGCSDQDDKAQETVVVYTCLDQIHSEPILRRFERATGIKVRPVYDAEAAKTTGLVNRLLARRSRPDCDVLWNNEVVQTERLAREGVLAEYRSPQAARFPARFRDPKGRWTGFAGRMRLIIYNTKLVPADRVPTGLADLTKERWRGQAAIARPFFGTTLTHMIALHQRWGPARLEAFLKDLRANQVALCPGNGPVRDLVAQGEYAFGLTDTDDAYAAIQAGKPVGVLVPDRARGALLIPNTVALVADGPNPEAGKKLIDFLLSAEVEKKLAAGDSAQIPLANDLRDVKTPWTDLLDDVEPMPFDIPRGAAAFGEVVDLLTRMGMDR